MSHKRICLINYYMRCRYYNEMATAALQVLHIATLVPSCRSAVLKCQASGPAHHQDAISVLLSAAEGQAFMQDPEVCSETRVYQNEKELTHIWLKCSSKLQGHYYAGQDSGSADTWELRSGPCVSPYFPKKQSFPPGTDGGNSPL